jgi:DNA-binding MarR family transcriptional regulator
MSDANVLETPEGLKYFAPQRGLAWLGLLQAHAELTRSLDAELQAKHGVSLSAYEMLSRLAHCSDGHMRMSDLAHATNLSLSRVSRLMDQLEGRGLVSRRSCPGDSRIVHATIEEPGREIVRTAQETFFAVVDERFFGRLSCDEVAQLGALLERLVEQDAGASC